LRTVPDLDVEELEAFRRPGPLLRLYRRLDGPGRATYVWTRFALMRGVALIQLVAFLVAANQLVPLVGERGVLPARWFLDDLRFSYGSSANAFFELPTLFFFGDSDGVLLAVAWVGVALSALALAGLSHPILALVLWALYISIAHVGQVFWGYGWESLLLEASFLAIFLHPLRGVRPLAARSPPPVPVVWLYRWLTFRVMFGAGLIKLRGDPCWTDLSCLDFHFETQPLPNPLTAFFHGLPEPVLHSGVFVNHVVELVVPFFLFGPRRVREVAGLLTIGFQLVLILSGNLSFLNWLTVIVALSSFDDRTLERLLPRRSCGRGAELVAATPRSRAHDRTVLALVAVVLVLSIAPTVNLVSTRQLMNASFDRLHLVSTYGAFGSVSRERYEVVLEGTLDAIPDESAEWRAWELPCKPGDPRRRPCIVSPYHYRLDWQMWFAALGDYESEPWIARLAWLLLHGERSVDSLFSNRPFPDRPPRWVRARLFRYELAGEPGNTWRRTYVADYLRPLSRDDAELLAWLYDQRLLR
jgi:hypothetical protein